MTLIVGIVSPDGVVIGTDSAVTFADGPRPTIAQDSRRKIEIIQDRVIVAGTGEVGLGQRFVDIIRRHWHDNQFRKKRAVEIGRILAAAATQDFAATGATRGSYGALVGIPCGTTHNLIEFAISDFQPEVKTSDSWYVSMGVAQQVADPLLGFMRRAFWGDTPPSRQDAVFATTMVLELGCEMAPTGVAKPIQMATLTPRKKGTAYLARRLSDEELLEHVENVKSVIEYFGNYREHLRGSDSPIKELPSVP